jgi:hypothetical protein
MYNTEIINVFYIEVLFKIIYLLLDLIKQNCKSKVVGFDLRWNQK